MILIVCLRRCHVGPPSTGHLAIEFVGLQRVALAALLRSAISLKREVTSQETEVPHMSKTVFRNARLNVFNASSNEAVNCYSEYTSHPLGVRMAVVAQIPSVYVCCTFEIFDTLGCCKVHSKRWPMI